MSKNIKRITAKNRPIQSAKILRPKGAQSDAVEQPKSKHGLILHLLRRKQGASLTEIQATSGWQAHSVRGFMSGTVKKRLGLKLQSSKAKNGERRYSIAS